MPGNAATKKYEQYIDGFSVSTVHCRMTVRPSYPIATFFKLVKKVQYFEFHKGSFCKV